MAKVTAAAVKELRALTGVAMMDCKKALVECDGDQEAAQDFLRKKGQAKAIKKSSRETSEGSIGMAFSEDQKSAGLVKIACETDFVARNDKFQVFVKQIAQQAQIGGSENFLQQELADGDGTVESLVTHTVSTLGENMRVMDVAQHQVEHGVVSGYIHSTGKIGVLVPLATDQACDAPELQTLAKDIAMHIAAYHAEAVNPEQVDQSVLDKEKEIFIAQAKESGKPDNIIEKMVTGRMKKFLKEVCVSSQPFVKDPDQTVDQLVKSTSKQLGVKITFDSFSKFQF